ncbi:MAG: tRNA uridine-5-carboxymethylaminomethyl(34) synthesis GTPase MnmE [Alcaligenaceae bacterium]
MRARQATYCRFPDAAGNTLDQGIAIYFEAPASYTGEDILELQGHGGPAVLQQVLNRCLAVGAAFNVRLATPGEFTLRAFLNDKIDLAQAEAIADLIDASSETAARAAAVSMSGDFSRRINTLSTAIVQLRLLVEATLDFPEEEIEFLEKYQAHTRLNLLQEELSTILTTSRQGVVLREGLNVVLAGEPNVGKSSLLNALSGQDLAIVTDIAGTTRDKVSQVILLDGVPITITDTAGLRDTVDTIEAIGIERTWAAIEQADVILHLTDTHTNPLVLDQQIQARRSPQSVVLHVCNKLDLQKPFATMPEQMLGISAKTGLGLDALRQKLLALAGWNPSQESPWLARQRHVDALLAAQAHLAQAYEYALQKDLVLDLFAEELRLAHEQLGLITGKMTPDELLGEIFSRFCIGK